MQIADRTRKASFMLKTQTENTINTINIKNKILSQVYNGLFHYHNVGAELESNPKLIHNINIQRLKFKNASRYKLQPKIRHRIVHMLDQLKSEQSKSRKNSKLVDTQLRQQLRKQHVDRCRVDIDLEMKFKEFQIVMRNKCLAIADSQLVQQTAFVANSYKQHSIIVKDGLIEIFAGVLSNLQKNYGDRVELIKFQHQNELAHIRDLHMNQLTKVNVSIAKIVNETKADVKNASSKLSQRKDEFLSMHFTQMLNLKLEYESKMSLLNDQFENLKTDEKLYKHYLNNHLQLTKENDEICKTFTSNQVLIDGYENQIKTMTKILQEISTPNHKKDKLKALKSSYFKLSRDFQDKRQVYFKGLKNLCVASTMSIDELEKKREKAVKILKYFESCHSYENKSSRCSFDSYKVYEQLSDVDYASTDINTYNSVMRNFWKKFNVTSLQIDILKREKTDLMNQNKMLKQKLKAYFSDK
jgi:hypothetical protein